MAKRKRQPEGFKWRGLTLNGVGELKDACKGHKAVIWASGPSFEDYDDSWVPEDWVRFSINETIQMNFPGFKRTPDFWVLSDLVIVEKYAHCCPPKVDIISTHRSSETIDQACPESKVYKILAEGEPIQRYDDGYRFFSRRSVVIAALQVCKWMGFDQVFCFGLDAFRLRSSYYFDKKDANSMNERQAPMKFAAPTRIRHKGERIFVTPALRGGAKMFEAVKRKGHWDGMEIYNVNSPASQVQVFEKLTADEFKEIVAADEAKKKAALEAEAEKVQKSAEESAEPKPKPKKKRGRPPKVKIDEQADTSYLGGD